MDDAMDLSLNDNNNNNEKEEEMEREKRKKTEEQDSRKEEIRKRDLEYHKLLEKELIKANKPNRDQSNEDDSDSDDEMLITSDKHQLQWRESNHGDGITIHNVFDLLPDETLIKIWSFLDPPSIGRLAQVCKRFRETSYDNHLWRESALMWAQKKNGGSDGIIQNANITRSFWVRQFRSYRRRERLEEETRLQNEKERILEIQKQRAAKFMKVTCYARFWEWIAVVSLILVTILSVLKLEGVINSRWAIIFIPFFFILMQSIIAPLMFDCMRSYFDYSFDKELEPDEEANRVCGPIFFFLAFSVPLNESLRTARSIIYPSVFLFTIWIILLVIKIDNPAVGIPYWGVFLPLMAFLFIFVQIPLWIGGKTVFTDSKRLDRIIISLLISLLLIFVILLALKLDGISNNWSWYRVMTPLWILKGLLVLLPIILSLITAFLSFTRNSSSYSWRNKTRWAEKAPPLCLTFIGLSVLVFAPLLTFEVLLAQALEGDSASFSLIFIPIFVLEGFGICGCCVVNCAFICSDPMDT